jgi:Putative beta-barrel porin 2
MFCWIVLVAATLSASAFAQEANDAIDKARFRFGPLRFTPMISVTSLGLDSNVFNEAANAKEDRTAAIGPAVDLWMKVGGSRISGRAAGSYLYFERYANQRAWNTDNILTWEAPLARITPFLTGSFTNAKSRPSYEIDSRVRVEAQRVTLGTTVKLSGRTALKLSGRRDRIIYNDQATFQSADLAHALNQTATAEELQLRYRLTSLTTFVVEAEAFQDRFGLDRLRNSNSYRMMPGFELKPSALISGRVFAGYRRFEPLTPTVQPYQGPAAAVEAAFSAHATRVAVDVRRDLAYSYQNTQPYYLLTDLGLSMTQRLSASWDIVLRGSDQTLDYARVVAPTPLAADGATLPLLAAQLDRIRQYGGGIGYRVGRTLRLGLDGSYFRRRSSEGSLREYEGWRAGASISYGSLQ